MKHSKIAKAASVLGMSALLMAGCGNSSQTNDKEKDEKDRSGRSSSVVPVVTPAGSTTTNSGITTPSKSKGSSGIGSGRSTSSGS